MGGLIERGRGRGGGNGGMIGVALTLRERWGRGKWDGRHKLILTFFVCVCIFAFVLPPGTSSSPSSSSLLSPLPHSLFLCLTSPSQLCSPWQSGPNMTLWVIIAGMYERSAGGDRHLQVAKKTGGPLWNDLKIQVLHSFVSLFLLYLTSVVSRQGL